MAYTDKSYYDETYRGEPVPGADFPSLLLRAEEIVEEMTMYRLSGSSFAAMPEDVKERVRKAVCAQVEYLDANGGSDVDTGTDIQSASLGKYSYARVGGGGEDGASGGYYAPRALRLLYPTGLLYRGGGSL
ncbi:MAG: hypothetical protein HFI66_12030 [Lachnospiraceae bacterium]|jgi:hypothetical protein|nr:hypothetical protein [Lachnospiraceae bacterium]